MNSMGTEHVARIKYLGDTFHHNSEWKTHVSSGQNFPGGYKHPHVFFLF